MAGELARAKEIFQGALTNLVKNRQAAAANAQPAVRPSVVPSDDGGISREVYILADNLTSLNEGED